VLGSGNISSTVGDGAVLNVTAASGISAGSMVVTAASSSTTQSLGRFTIAKAADGTSVSVAFSGTILVGETWTLTVTKSSTNYSAAFTTTTTSLVDLAAGLRDALALNAPTATSGLSGTSTNVTQITAGFGT